MKLATEYFKHPLTGRMIRPNEMYEDYTEIAATEPVKKMVKKSGRKTTENELENKEDDTNDAGATLTENTPNA